MPVSVVIPTLNSVDTLLLQLDALVPQLEATGSEVLVVDNGSTDRTAELVARRFGHIPAVRFLEASERRSAGLAKNAGVRQAAHARIAFCDADDLVAPNWVEAVIDAFDHGPVVSIPLEFRRLNPPHIGPNEPLTSLTFCGCPSLGGGAFAIEADLYTACGGFSEGSARASDTEFSMRLYRMFRIQPVVADTCVHVRMPTSRWGRVRRRFHQATVRRPLAERFSDVTTEPLWPTDWRLVLGRLARYPLSAERERELTLGIAATAFGTATGEIRRRTRRRTDPLIVGGGP